MNKILPAMFVKMATHTHNTAVEFLSSSLPVCLTATVSHLNLQQLSTEGQGKQFFFRKEFNCFVFSFMLDVFF